MSSFTTVNVYKESQSDFLIDLDKTTDIVGRITSTLYGRPNDSVIVSSFVMYGTNPCLKNVKKITRD